MAHEIEVDDILIPQLRRRGRKLRLRKLNKQSRRKFRGLKKFVVRLSLVLIILWTILSFADIGGNVILGMTEKYFSEHYKISLTADRITGNPIKGYTLHNLALTDESEDQQILSAGFLSAHIKLLPLLSGRIRLAEISLGKISMDIDKFITRTKNATNFTFPHMENLNRFTVTNSAFLLRTGVAEVKKLDVNFKNSNINVDGNINGIKLAGHLDMNTETGFTTIDRADISLGSGKILAIGGLTDNNLDFHASIEDIDLKEITALYPELLREENFDGKINLNVDALGVLNQPKISGYVNYKGTKINSLPIERLSTNFEYFDNRIGLTDIQANILNMPIQGELALSNLDNEKFSVFVQLDGSEANLSGLDKVLLVPELKALSGKVSSFNANINGPVDSLNGMITLTAPRIAYTDRAFTNIRAQMKLNNSDTAHVDGKFNFEGANGYIQGTIESLLLNPNFNLNAKIVDLDIKRIENIIPDASDYKFSGNLTTELNLNGTIFSQDITGSFNSKEFSAFGQKFSKPSINFAYADNVLTLTKSQGTLNGMPIKLTGTIEPLFSSNPNLNINAAVTISNIALRTYIPDIDNYSLKGNINAGVKVQGTVYNPTIKYLLSSSKLEAMDILNANDLEIITDQTTFENVNINASAKNVTANGLTLSNVNVSLSKNNDNIALTSFNAKSGSGTVTGTGIAVTSEDILLDFNFKFMNLALDSLLAASGVKLNGNLSGALKIFGAGNNPTITLTTNIPMLNIKDLSLSNVIANLSGNMNSIKLDRVRAELEEAEIIALGNMQLKPSTKFNIAINGNNIKLQRVLSENILSGDAAFHFTLSGNENNITGNGKLTSSAIEAQGKYFTDVNLPLSYTSSDIFTANNGTAKLSGKVVSLDLTKELGGLFK